MTRHEWTHATLDCLLLSDADSIKGYVEARVVPCLCGHVHFEEGRWDMVYQTAGGLLDMAKAHREVQLAAEQRRAA